MDDGALVAGELLTGGWEVFVGVDWGAGWEGLVGATVAVLAGWAGWT